MTLPVAFFLGFVSGILFLVLAFLMVGLYVSRKMGYDSFRDYWDDQFEDDD